MLTIDSPRIITPPGSRYHGWPTIARRKNGELLVVCSGNREEHLCPYGRVQLFRSSDSGDTWSGPFTLTDGPLDDRDCGILETAKGTLIVNYFTSARFALVAGQHERGERDWLTPEQRKAWGALRDAFTGEDYARELGFFALRSEDGGKTWSKRIDTMVNTPHGPTQLADGRLLYVGRIRREPFVGLIENARSDDTGAAESADDGKTWRVIGKVPTAPGDEAKHYHELHQVQASDGRIVAQIRNHNRAHPGETLQCESFDGGRTWTVPHAIGVWGTPSHLTRLADGRLLMTYGHRRKPYGAQARFSEDHGQTWSDPVVVYGEGDTEDLGYASSVQCDDGSFVTLWYEGGKRYPQSPLRIAKWRE